MPLKRGDWQQFAKGVVADSAPVDAGDADRDSGKLDLSDHTIEEIRELVEKGYLSAAEVFEAESNGKKRKTLLAEFDPSK